MLAEAGTGVGKTLGYLAPGLAVGRGQRPGGVGLHLHPRPAAPDRAREPRASIPTRRSRARKAVVRKGRENYLCLLNFQEAVNAGQLGGGDLVGAGAGRALGPGHAATAT